MSSTTGLLITTCNGRTFDFHETFLLEMDKMCLTSSICFLHSSNDFVISYITLTVDDVHQCPYSVSIFLRLRDCVQV